MRPVALCKMTTAGMLLAICTALVDSYVYGATTTASQFDQHPSELEMGEYCQLEVFHASCAPGHVIMMTSAVYGRMRTGRCVKQDYGFIGCSADVLRYADRFCSGRQVCQFPVAELHGNQPCPDDLTPYLEASYRCVPVVTAENARCRVGQPITLRAQSGYLSSSVTSNSGRGAPDCPWRLTVERGQRINLTLVNFARVGLPATSTAPSHHTPVPSPRPGDGTRRPKVCYQLAKLRERRYSRVLTECEGSPRRSHVFLSTSNVMEVDIIVAKVLKVHFLIHFQAVGCADPTLSGGTLLRREGDTATVGCNITNRPADGVSATSSGDNAVWTVRCVSGRWRGLASMNCTSSSDSSTSRIHTMATDDHTWTGMGHFFPLDTFPYSVLLVVSVGVALGVFVGGVLLVAAARYFKRLSGNGDDDDLYSSGRCRTSSTYTDHHAYRPAASAAVVIATTSDITDYHDDDGRTVLTSHAPAPVAMATECLCSEHVDNRGRLQGPGRPPSRAGNRLKSRLDYAPSSDCHPGEHVVRPS